MSKVNDTRTLPLFETEHQHTLLLVSKEVEGITPCPECGANAHCYHYECSCGMKGWTVICWRCYLKGVSDLMAEATAEEAVEEWNRRVAVDDVD